MFIYAGIDEAGYGPAFGPMTVARFALAIPGLDADAGRDQPPDLWRRLSRAVCRRLSETRGKGAAAGRLAINDSKMLTSKAAGIAHLERGVHAFAGLMEAPPELVDAADWLDLVGSTTHHDLTALPWYAADADRPWQPLPVATDAGGLAIARGLLRNTAERIGVQTVDLGCAVVFEDRFNKLVGRAGSKAAVSFSFVCRHLAVLLERFGEYHPLVVVDRQSGRTRYAEPMRRNLPGIDVEVISESDAASAYAVRDAAGRQLDVRFMTEAESAHMPVALASMAAKYTRELLMARFKAWWSAALPDVAPTAGYGTDAKRFTQEIAPRLAGLGLTMDAVRRRA